jgi:hypothetical protein
VAGTSPKNLRAFCRLTLKEKALLPKKTPKKHGEIQMEVCKAS